MGNDGGYVRSHAPHLGSGPVSAYGVTFLRRKDGGGGRVALTPALSRPERGLGKVLPPKALGISLPVTGNQVASMLGIMMYCYVTLIRF